MIHMTNQMMQYIIKKENKQNGGHGVSTMRKKLIGLCGQQLNRWQPEGYDQEKDHDKHYSTAIAWCDLIAKEKNAQHLGLMMHYKKVNCPKCIEILKENGL